MTGSKSLRRCHRLQSLWLIVSLTGGVIGPCSFLSADTCEILAKENDEQEQMYQDYGEYELKDTVPIYKDWIDIAWDSRPAIPMTPEYITIHNTGNARAGADAALHADYLQKGLGKKRVASWHFTVDDHQIFNHIPTDEIAYHAGDSLGDGNMKSIGIEICENADGNYRQAEANAETLAAILLDQYDLPVTALRRHYDWSGKQCPHVIMNKEQGSVGWEQFQDNVADKLKSIQNYRIAKKKKQADLEKAKTLSAMTDPLTIQAGKTASLLVYQMPAAITYSLDDQGEAQIESTAEQSARVLGDDDSIHYQQCIQLLDSDYKIDDPDQEFKNLLKDPDAVFQADPYFFDCQFRAFVSDGISGVRTASKKGNAVFRILNTIAENVSIITTDEASVQNLPVLTRTQRLEQAAKEDKLDAVLNELDLTSTNGLVEIMKLGRARSAKDQDDTQKPSEDAALDQPSSTLFQSTDPSIIRVDDNGTLHALAAGTASVYTSHNGVVISRCIQVE